MAEQLTPNVPISSSSDPATIHSSIYPPLMEHCPSKNCIHKKGIKEESFDVTRKKKKKKQQKKLKRVESESEDSDIEVSSASSDSSDSGESSSDSETSSEEETRKSKKKKEASRSKKVLKASKSTKAEPKLKKRSSKSARKVKYDTEDDNGTSRGTSIDSDGFTNLRQQLESQGLLKSSKKRGNLLKDLLKLASRKDVSDDGSSMLSKKSERNSADKQDGQAEQNKEKDTSKAKYKRLDEIWDENLFDYRLRETSDQKKTDEYEEYVFTVRRKFDIENHHQSTMIDVKSAPLVECLKVVMDSVQGISLVERNPKLVPDTLFLFLEDFRDYKDKLTADYRDCRLKKVRKEMKTKVKHLSVLIDYLDKDYDETKRTLYPMLANGTITFDLLWTLYKPNTVVYKSTYGDDSVPRAFKIDYATKQRHYVKGHYYDIEGKYLDFDGENFGKAWINAEVPHFQGSRKITSLPCYPLHYNQKYESLKDQLIQRGEKFLRLAGMNYKFCQGLCYVKKDNKILRVNVNSRVMIDPKTFRRINPNYLLCDLEPRDIEDDDDECQCETQAQQQVDNELRLFVLEKDSKDEAGVEPKKLIFTEEELIVASPLVVGFSFNEKLWVEFPVSEISEVKWNDGAFDSLVIPEKHKSIVKALVSAHGQHASKSIDDVVAGKGKGLVAVLHGKPGLGKTLTCEAVADLLRRPLYAVSAGDLGTSVTSLEIQLQMILDVAHTWGAVLLLDEADVFLEQRSLRDSHRNAMVSVMLRQLEYFCGILILTTNRVEIFDEAFVSRIHLSLRYGELTAQARKTIWKTFINRVADTSDSASTSTSSVAHSENSSTGVPTPGTTCSTPNSGRTTPAPSTDVAEHAPIAATASTSTSTPAASIKSADSDQTITPTARGTSQTADPTSGSVSSSSSSPATEHFTEANYTELSRIDVNGRQIKNAVKTAQALALYEGVPMGMGHLRRCIEVGRSFELDLKGGKGYEDAMRSYT